MRKSAVFKIFVASNQTASLRSIPDESLNRQYPHAREHNPEACCRHPWPQRRTGKEPQKGNRSAPKLKTAAKTHSGLNHQKTHQFERSL